jgi:hypothetical protein
MTQLEYMRLRVIFSPFREKVGIKIYDLITGDLVKKKLKNRLCVELNDKAENSRLTICNDEEEFYMPLSEIGFQWSYGGFIPIKLAYDLINLAENYGK